MNSNEHYLDYNATAPLLPKVWEAMQTVQATSYGNPSSPHSPGRRARNRLEEARRQLASLLGVEYHVQQPRGHHGLHASARCR